VEEGGDICENLGCAGFVFGKWQMKD